ncbi:MAG: motility protein A [Fusobacteriaceae bacterium]|nr:motility protein A [Fusobacteriaceae bacterium]MBN2839113.1 motility protein A [Fusobacteriaceae bacterium]
MDIATPVGIVLIFTLMLVGMGFNIGPFFDVPSLAIVVGGTFGALFVGYPLKQVIGIIKVMMKTIKPPKIDNSNTIEALVKFSEKARKEGLLSLEAEISQIEDSFLKKGLQMVVDGTDPELVKNILDNELSAMELRHSTGKSLLKFGAALGPAFGMIGTLIGLILMLGNLSDPGSLGPNMAVALITTLYGSMIANIFFDPMANKVDYYSGLEINGKELIIEGILSIQNGDNPKILKEKLKTFLTPEEIKKMEAQEGE